MAKKESNYVTRTPEEELMVVSMATSFPMMTLRRYAVIIIMSVTILGTYLAMNYSMFPGYPVVNTFAEKNESFAEHYPPIRMNEWITYSITTDLISGTFRDEESFSRLHSLGFSALAVPLTVKFGEIGPYYTNAFIVWLCAIVFFLLMIHFVQFPLAVATTFILAFATPNLFFAESAYCEPTSQLLTLLSIFFLMKVLSSSRESLYCTLCGFTVGLNMFVQPIMALSVVLFAVIIFIERSRRSLKDMSIVFLVTGYCISLFAFFAVYKIVLGYFPENLFSQYNFISDNLYQQTDNGSGNIIVGIWRFLFDSPHGLVFVMPITMIVPLGIILMWRKKLRSLSLLIASLILFVIIVDALHCCSITGESVGSRQLLPIMPLFVIPLAFVWDEETGEKIWFAIMLVLTMYMCSFGWWTGTVREKGFFIGVLHDNDARSILLARKDKLNKPAFKSSSEIVEQFFGSLNRHDMKRWLQTLDRTSIDAIKGFERIVFSSLVEKAMSHDSSKELFITSVDPDNGIRLIMPEIDTNSDLPQYSPDAY